MLELDETSTMDSGGVGWKRKKIDKPNNLAKQTTCRTIVTCLIALRTLSHFCVKSVPCYGLYDDILLTITASITSKHACNAIV